MQELDELKEMGKLDKLLERFNDIKNKHDRYLLDLNSIRAEIEYSLEKLSKKSYQNDSWKVIYIDEKEQQQIKIQNFLNALDKANLDDIQREILKDAISKRNHQEHVRIIKI